MQTRIHSFIEAITQVIIGYFLAVTVQLIIFPLYDMEVTIGENLQIGLIFLVVSAGRMYAIRRIFEWTWMKIRSS